MFGPLAVVSVGILCTVIGNAAHGGSTSWHSYPTVPPVPEGPPPVTIGDWSLGALPRLWTAVITVAAVDLMESIALGKSMARKNGYKVRSAGWLCPVTFVFSQVVAYVQAHCADRFE